MSKAIIRNGPTLSGKGANLIVNPHGDGVVMAERPAGTNGMERVYSDEASVEECVEFYLEHSETDESFDELMAEVEEEL